MIAMHPTYGLDVGAAEYVRKQMINLRDGGGAVLLVSEDLDELFMVCDRIAVIYSGQIMDELTPDKLGHREDWLDDGRNQGGRRGRTDMNIELFPRENVTPRLKFLTLSGALFSGLVAVGIVFAMNGVNPFMAIFAIFKGSFGSLYGIFETITKAIPLILIGSGLALAFKAKFWNIGAESQLLAGAILATWVGLHWGPHLPTMVIVPLMFLAAFIGGGIWGMIPAVLKIRFGINEVISTLMLNYVGRRIRELSGGRSMEGPDQRRLSLH